MASPNTIPFVSYAEYLASEAHADVKHEWLNGMVFAMSRGAPAHSSIANMVTALLTMGIGPECRVYNSDVCLLVEQTHFSTYADGSVVCGPVETTIATKDGKSLGEAVTNPTVIIEVLSRSTEKNDRGAKFEHYKRLRSLREYVLVGQYERAIERFVLREDGTWSPTIARSGERIEIHGVSISVDDVYRGV